MKKNSIFSDIIEKKLPASIIYEDEIVLAFLDINPLTPGHVLLVTKGSYKTLTELPANTFEALFSAAQKIVNIQMRELGAEGVNWLQNNGEAAGQEIDHFHIHLIPRMSEDDVGWKWRSSQYETPEERDQLAKLLSENIK